MYYAPERRQTEVGPVQRCASRTAAPWWCSDPRRLGGVQLDPDVSGLGPDAATVTAGRAGRGPRRVAGRPQGPTARPVPGGGVGNLIADEVLWRAGLVPAAARPDSLTPTEVRRLHRHLRRTVDLLGRRGGSHTGDLMDERYPAVAAPATAPSWPGRRSGVGPRGGARPTRSEAPPHPVAAVADPDYSSSSARTLSAWPSAFTWYQARADLAVRTDQEGRPDDPDRLLAVQGLLAPGPVGLAHRVVGVGEQGELEAVLLPELLVLVGAVGRDAQHGHLGPGKGPQVVVELAGLLGAARRVVPRVEVHDHRLPAKSLSETLAPSWSGRVKAGALSPASSFPMVGVLS